MSKWKPLASGWQPIANAFCPGEGARDNSCSSSKGGGDVNDDEAALKAVRQKIGEVARRQEPYLIGVREEDREEWEALHKEERRIVAKGAPAREKKRKEEEEAHLKDIRAQISEDAKRVAVLPVFQRRNGWEIVKDEHEANNLVLRHPVTKEEVYRHSKLGRIRKVADESGPDA